MQLEARSHIRVQRALDKLEIEGQLPSPASSDFIRWLHREFYVDAPDEALTLRNPTGAVKMVPGEWRDSPGQDVAVGRHIPPASDRAFASASRTTPGAVA